MRVGLGQDVHRLAEGRRLVVGGVVLDERRGAVAHSDGDALLHAVIDALLGAAGLGDIGDQFPDADPQYAGIDSRELLRRAAALVAGRGFRVVNIDATVTLEKPRLGPLKQQMREVIAADLGLPADAVNVKAKTAEGLGELGRGEAVAAQAVALIEKAEIKPRRTRGTRRRGEG